MGKRTCLAVAASMLVMASFATTWYVDADNGNNDWNGKASFADAVPADKAGPKKTLGVFTSLVRSGDTIYVAPGWYTNGVSSSDSHFRFYTAAGSISLISTGSATDTFIVGAADGTVAQDSPDWGCGANAVVPIKMLGGNNLVQGFTILGGRQINYSSAYGGGAVFAPGVNTDCMIDCVITNCIASRGGGVNNLGNALRCRFTGNFAGEGSHAVNLNSAVNCIFEDTDGYAVYNGSSGGLFINCLCRGNKKGNLRTNGGPINVYNSVFLLGGTLANARNKNCSFFNCFFDYDPNGASEAISGTNGECRVVATGGLKFNADGSPMKGNPVMGAANSEYYESNFPMIFGTDEKPFDFAGNARVVGNGMDIGAFERNDSTIDDNEWFVDAVGGDDLNSGKSPSHAFRTLARASTNLLMETGSTVYVAEGTYSNGVVAAAVSGVDATDSRMMVPDGVDFVATGRREATIIEGESSSATESGIGFGAARCCLMCGGSIRGFTLRNGNVNVGSTTSGDMGGGIRSTSASAYAYDCEIKGCNAVRGGGTHGVVLVRCHVHDNTNDTTGVTPARSTAGTDAFECSGYNTIVKGDCYRGTTWLNCTLLGKCWGSGTSFVNCYIGEDGAAAASVAASFTNCICAGTFKSFTSKDGCRENIQCQFDEDWRPRRHRSELVNAGDNALYAALFPLSLSAYRNIDYAGGERVLEERIDIGAGEFIWNPTGIVISFR